MKTQGFPQGLWILLLAIALSACSNEAEDEQKTLQYNSHIDQALFFQEQGELAASLVEARNAATIRPGKLRPHLIVAENLLIAGDGVTAQRQLESLLEKEELVSTAENRAKMHYLLARSHFLQQEYVQASDVLQRISQPDEDLAARLAILQGRIALATNKPGTARTHFEQAKTHPKTRASALLGLSQVAQMSGDEKRAQKRLAQALEEDPSHADSLLWKGRLAMAREDLDQAESAFNQALEIIGKYDMMTAQKYKALASLSQLLRAQGKVAQAEVYREILAQSPAGTVAALIKNANQRYVDGDLTGAARYLEEIRELAPGSEQGRLMLGLIRFQQGQFQQTADLLKEMVDLDDNPEARAVLDVSQFAFTNDIEASTLLGQPGTQQASASTLALIASALAQAGEPESSRLFFEEAIHRDPKAPAPRLGYIQLLISLGQGNQALEQARTGVKKNPDNPRLNRLLLQLLMGNGDLAAATEALQQWRAQTPESPSPLAILSSAELAELNDQQQKATEAYRRAIEIAPELTEPYISLARIQAEAGNSQTAMETLETLLKRQPNNQTALVALLRLGKTAPAHRETLNKILDELATKYPQATGPRLIQLTLKLQNQNLDQAGAYTQQLIAGAPDSTRSDVAGIYSNLAGNQLLKGQVAEGRNVLAEGLKHFPNHLQLNMLAAEVAFSQSREEAAQNHLDRIKRHHPNAVRPFMLEGDYYSRTGDYRAALSAYNLAWQKSPAPDIAVRKADTLRLLEQNSEAGETLQEALKQWPDSEALRLQNAVHIHYVNEQPQQAMEAYRRVLDIAPENITALNNLAWLLQENNQAEEALKLAQRAYELDPGSAAVADTYGWLLFKQERQEESLPILYKAYRREPESREIALHFAEALKATGHADRAREILKSIQ